MEQSRSHKDETCLPQSWNSTRRTVGREKERRRQGKACTCTHTGAAAFRLRRCLRVAVTVKREER